MCSNPNWNSCWVLEADKDTVESQFIRLWEFTYSAYSFFNLIECVYPANEEREIYLRLKAEGLLDKW